MLPQTITEKYIRNMNWRDFELFVAKVLTWNDYDAIVTPPSNDEGKDIVAKKNNITFYIECKHWKNQIGREYLEKLVGAAARDGIRNIIFVTTSSYHTNAKSYASDLNLQGLFHLQLLDTSDLLRLCKNHSNITSPKKSTSSVKAHKPISSISASVRIIKLNDVISIKEITETNPHWQLTYPTVIILNNPIAQKKINADLSKSINWLRGLYEKGEFYNYGGKYASHYYDDKVLSISIWLYRYKKGACGDHSFTWDTVYDLSTGDRIPLSKYVMVNANDLQDYYPTHSYSESGKYLEAPNKTIIDQVPDNYFIDNDGKSICIVFPSYKLSGGAEGHAYIKLSSGNISYLNRKNSANQPPIKKQSEVRANLKASKFKAYTKANKMDYFFVKEMHDDADTIVFQSNLKVEGRTIPVSIITDNTVYTIIRVQIGTHVLNETNKPILLQYLNQLNRSYKVFKYVTAEDGSIFLDTCLPNTNDSFDAEIVRVVLDVIVDHLNNEYKNIMKQAWE